MATRSTRARVSEKPAAAPQVNDFDALINDFETSEVSSKYSTESGRRKVSPAFRSTIASAIIKRKEGEKLSFCLLIFKKGGAKTKSLVYSQATDDTIVGKQLDIKTLEYVATFKDGQHYLNITGKVL